MRDGGHVSVPGGGHVSVTLRRAAAPEGRQALWLVLFVGTLLGLLCIGRPAAARERVAVVVIDADRVLSENLSEVVLARVAQLRGYELVGLAELEGPLQALSGPELGDLTACVSSVRCLARVATAARAAFVVRGTVEPRGDRVEVHLALVDTGREEIEAEAQRVVERDLDHLLSALDATTLEIFPRVEAVPEPPKTPTAAPLGTPPLASSEGHPRPIDTGAGHSRVKLYVGLGAGGLGVVSVSAGLVAGSLSMTPSAASTRADRQADLDRRKTYANAANILFVAGGALLATAAVVVVWP